MLRAFIFLLLIAIPSSQEASRPDIIGSDFIKNAKIEHILYSIALIINAIALIFSIEHRKKDHDKSHIDEFWLRKIIIPEIISETENLVSNIKNEWKTIKNARNSSLILIKSNTVQEMNQSFIQNFSKYSDIDENSRVSDLIKELTNRVDEFDGEMINIFSNLSQDVQASSMSNERIDEHSQNANILIDRFHKYLISSVAIKHKNIATHN